jgi:hypothetical protein
MKRFPVLAAWSACSLFLAGCGGGGDSLKVPPLHPVSGTVKLDGKPLPGASVTFLPVGESKVQVASGVTDDAGHFTVAYVNGEPGAAEGEYKVLISKMMLPDGKPLAPGMMAATAGARDIIPMKYKNPDDLINKIMVSAGGKSDLVFELKSK